MDSDAFPRLLARKRPVGWAPPATLLAVDPGDTTGYAVFRGGALADKGQLPGTIKDLTMLLDLEAPDQVVAEEYRIYAHKLAEHAGSTVPTLRLIGALEALCEQREIPLVFQSAQQAKGFMTDEKLRSWCYYPTGHRHAADAIRHGCFALLCNPAVGEEAA